VALRRITAEEGARWQRLAAEHGYGLGGRRTVTNRFVVEQIDDENGIVTVRLITPCVALVEGDDGEAKASPVMFDRDAEGHIVFPGRWWHERIAQLVANPRHDESTRTRVAEFARDHTFLDIALPADTDTIAMRMRDENGETIVREALPPDTVIDLIIFSAGSPN
jgi:hypothetical protein